MTTYTLEIHYTTGRYVLRGLTIKVLLQEIQKADDCGRCIIWLKAYQDKPTKKE